MATVSAKMSAKVRHVKDIEITEKTLYETVRKRKNLSTPAIDGIQKYCWKKLKGTRDITSRNRDTT